MTDIKSILARTDFSRDDLIALLSASEPDQVEAIHVRAEKVLLENCGPWVYYRGLIEFSNICACDCLYCGIRKGNTDVHRYSLDSGQILDAALWCAEQGYGSIVLQSGERSDNAFVAFVENAVARIKQASRSERLPDGLGITLCVGEQTGETYQRFFDAGAHRYLLRIETSSPELFSRLHPSSQTFKNRLNCLRLLKEIGFQTGTGVMIGFPGQTVTDLANDLLFFKEVDIDMIGMGPYIVHSGTPMAPYEQEIALRRDWIFSMALRMIACARLLLRDVNIAATTALQAMRHDGREEGLRYGANIIMPQLTPTEVRKDYLLYEGKPCLDENAVQCRSCLERRVTSAGRTIAVDQWGDSVHASRKSKKALKMGL